MFKFCRIRTTNIVCYDNGLILRFNKCSKKWTVCKETIDTSKYLRVRIDGKNYLWHRVVAHVFGILDIHSPLFKDHIDRFRTNNSISNFKVVTRQQNQFNRGAKGYWWNGNKWQASIRLNGKLIYLGIFDTEEEAHQAYLEAKKIYHKI